MIYASGNKLYYHIWDKENSTHYYEIDFLINKKTKLIPFEIKSGSIKSHPSMDAFSKKYSKLILKKYLISQHDYGNEEMLINIPFYLLPNLLND